MDAPGRLPCSYNPPDAFGRRPAGQPRKCARQMPCAGKSGCAPFLFLSIPHRGGKINRCRRFPRTFCKINPAPPQTPAQNSARKRERQARPTVRPVCVVERSLRAVECSGKTFVEKLWKTFPRIKRLRAGPIPRRMPAKGSAKGRKSAPPREKTRQNPILTCRILQAVEWKVFHRVLKTRLRISLKKSLNSLKQLLFHIFNRVFNNPQEKIWKYKVYIGLYERGFSGLCRNFG